MGSDLLAERVGSLSKYNLVVCNCGLESRRNDGEASRLDFVLPFFGLNFRLVLAKLQYGETWDFFVDGECRSPCGRYSTEAFGQTILDTLLLRDIEVKLSQA